MDKLDLKARNLHAVAVSLWAARLGSFLFSRVLADGKDRRFDKIKTSPSRFLFAWTMQGVWVAATLWPTLLLLRKSAPPLKLQNVLGLAMWAVGFAVEVTADRQKRAFRADPANEGSFISSGLWAASRHPNYVGEVFLWAGLFVSASASFIGLSQSQWEWLSVLCPIFNYLLIAKLSGVPMLEKSALKCWGGKPEYQEYLKKTPEMFPIP